MEVFLFEPSFGTPCLPLNAREPDRVTTNGICACVSALKELVPELFRLSECTKAKFAARLIRECESSDRTDPLRKEGRQRICDSSAPIVSDDCEPLDSDEIG